MDDTSEELYNIFRGLFSDLSNITMYDTYNDYVDNARSFNSRRSRYSNNYTNNYSNSNNNNSSFTNNDICNNMVFNVINEYNVNMLEYNVNMREFFFRDSNNNNNNNNTNSNFIEYNNNISDYNSNIRRFLDLISSINYNNNNNNNTNRNNRHNENSRENTREYRRQQFNHNNMNIPDTGPSFGIPNTSFGFGTNQSPSQVFSYFLPNNRPRTFTNVIVRPSERQILDAIEIIIFNENETYNNTSCPITMEEFDDGEQICQIKHCGHNFREDALRNWFRTNVRCPVCRYDIRDYVISDVSNGNHLSGINNYPTGFLNRDDINLSNNDISNNVTMDYSGNTIPRLNVNTRRSSSGNLSNIIQSYVEQHITPFVEELNSNLTDFDIILPIIYYNDISGSNAQR
jgi:hypothetical protein